MALRQALRHACGPAARALLADIGETDPVVAIQRRAAQLIDEVSFDGPPFTGDRQEPGELRGLGEWLGRMREAGVPAAESGRQIVVEHLRAHLQEEMGTVW